MKNITLPLPILFGIVSTRALLGAGLALLFGDRLDRQQRRKLGILLTTIGVVSTVPFARRALRRIT
ncbi:MAG: hypothetical protein ABIT76_04290 [Chthoniobacterales bacterium]